MTGWGLVVVGAVIVFVLMALATRPERPDPPHDGRWYE